MKYMMNETTSLPIEILLVEDNPADVELAQFCFHESRIHTRLHVVRNGMEALQFLRHEAPFQHSIVPDMILLDLNLPIKKGHEVLDEIKSDPVLRVIPVIILSSSKAKEDVLRSYHLHANSYLTKPLGVEPYMDMVASIERFWFELAILPKGRTH